MDTTSSSLLILLIAFGVQITAAGLSSVLYTGSKMHTTGASPTIVDCTSEYRYISGMHGWRFEPICFLIGPAAAKITVLLREDLTCAVFQPLIYFSHVHEASKAVCPTSLPDDGGNSTFGILGQLYHSSESLGHIPRYLDWKFMLLLILGLVLWVFLLYELFSIAKRIVRDYGGLTKGLTCPIDVSQDGFLGAGILTAVKSILKRSPSTQEQPVQLQASEVMAGILPKGSNVSRLVEVQSGCPDHCHVEETSSVSPSESLAPVESMMETMRVPNVGVGLNQEHVPVTSTLRPQGSLPVTGDPELALHFSAGGVEAVMDPQQLQRSKQQISPDDIYRVALPPKIDAEDAVDPGPQPETIDIRETAEDGHSGSRAIELREVADTCGQNGILEVPAEGQQGQRDGKSVGFRRREPGTETTVTSDSSPIEINQGSGAGPAVMTISMPEDTPAAEGFADRSVVSGTSIPTKSSRKSKRGKKDLQMADGKLGGGGSKSHKGKERGSEVSNATRTDPFRFVPPTVHHRPVAEAYREVRVSRGNQGVPNINPMTPDEFQKDLYDYIQKQKLDAFYPKSVAKDSPVQKLALKAAQQVAESKHLLTATEPAANMGSSGAGGVSNIRPPSMAKTGRYYADICKTALYKTVLLIDDSKSMRDDNRRDTLQGALERVAELTTTIDPEGLSIRFLNYPRLKEHQVPWGLDGIQDVLRMRTILAANLWKGGTELGGMLLEKVLEPLVFDKARLNQLHKPVLISIITDGEPDHEDHGRSLKEVIGDCKRQLREQYPHYGENAVVFHITQIGNSPAASNFLDDLAQDPVVGRMIYCTSEHIDDQVMRYENDPTREAYNLWWVNELMVAIKG